MVKPRCLQQGSATQSVLAAPVASVSPELVGNTDSQAPLRTPESESAF